MQLDRKERIMLPPVPLWAPGIGPLPVPPFVIDPDDTNTGIPGDPEQRSVQNGKDL